jgi:hypothetical protein
MKKLLIIGLLLLTLFPGGAHAQGVCAGSPFMRAEPDGTAQSVREIQKMVYPALAGEVKARYGLYARIERTEIQVRSVEKTSRGDLMLTVQIMPFTGPHNSIALVDVSILCTSDGVEIVSFEPVRVFAGAGRVTNGLTHLRLSTGD